MLPFQKILCPVDFSEPSYLALEKATELAAFFKTPLCVLHVVLPMATELGTEITNVPNYEEDRIKTSQDQLTETIAARVPAEVDAYPLTKLGSAADRIEAAAKEEGADLIVIATHGHTGWRHLVFGSVAEKVLRLAHCPVLVVHAPRQD